MLEEKRFSLQFFFFYRSMCFFSVGVGVFVVVFSSMKWTYKHEWAHVEIIEQEFRCCSNRSSSSSCSRQQQQQQKCIALHKTLDVNIPANELKMVNGVKFQLSAYHVAAAVAFVCHKSSCSLVAWTYVLFIIAFKQTHTSTCANTSTCLCVARVIRCSEY